MTKPLEAAPAPAKKRINPIKLKQLEDRVVALEKSIGGAETEIAELEAALANYSSASDPVRTAQRLDELRTQHEGFLAEWEKASEELAAVQ
ncbi:MAG: hypothetical protein FJW32_29510 [Acidobacteria bacterium]|nr:hypothetical protein [Acidobacteriota bacterium]